MIVSNIRWMSESSEVEDGGVGSTDASAAESPIGGGGGGGGGGAPKKDSTLGRLELSHIWGALYRRKEAPIGATIWTGSDARNCSIPKCNKILWIKTGKKREWAEELLWTSIKERMKR